MSTTVFQAHSRKLCGSCCTSTSPFSSGKTKAFRFFTLLHRGKKFFFDPRYYGLWLWFPELFNKLDQYNQNHTEPLSVCEFTEFQAENNDDASFCDTPIPNSEVFLNSFIISLSALPGNIWTIYHMDKLGRKFFLGKQKFVFLTFFWLAVPWQ